MASNCFMMPVNKISALVSGVLLAVSLSACQTTQSTVKAPNWILNPPQNGDIIYGVGSSNITNDQAKAMQAATESARIEIAKNINIAISANTNVEQTSNGQQSSLFFKEAINNSVPSIEISGINVLENYIDENKHLAYVLAEFDKQQAIFSLEEKIEQLDLTMAQLNINQQAPALNKLKQAIKVQQLFAQREKLNAKINQLGGNTTRLSTAQQQLLTNIETVFENLSFSINSTSEHKQLAQQLSQALTAQGLKIQEHGDFQLSLKIHWHQIEKNNTFYSFADASVTISNEQQLIKNFVTKAKGVSSDEVLAKNKTIDKLAADFIKSISNSFLQ